MSKFFLPFGIALFLIIPFVFVGDVYADLKRQKVVFSIRLFGFLKIIGGYITVIREGIAFHISRKKAIILKFGDVEAGKKQFSVFKVFRFLRINLLLECGTNTFLPSLAVKRVADILLKAVFQLDFKSKIYVYEEEVFSLSLRTKFWLNGLILIIHLINFIIKKWRHLWKKKLVN